MKILILSLTFIISINTMAQKEPDQPVTVAHVDLQKYIGLWFEIARIPNSFQKKCMGSTTAYYSLNSDGTIKVVNSCTKENAERSTADGIARVVDTITNSKLEVSFVSIFGIHLFWGDYWIIGLDEDYSYAVIGTPNRKYGWILSRTKKLPDEKLTAAYNILKKNGYNPEDFISSYQE